MLITKLNQRVNASSPNVSVQSDTIVTAVIYGK